MRYLRCLLLLSVMVIVPLLARAQAPAVPQVMAVTVTPQAGWEGDTFTVNLTVNAATELLRVVTEENWPIFDKPITAQNMTIKHNQNGDKEVALTLKIVTAGANPAYQRTLKALAGDGKKHYTEPGMPVSFTVRPKSPAVISATASPPHGLTGGKYTFTATVSEPTEFLRVKDESGYVCFQMSCDVPGTDATVTKNNDGTKTVVFERYIDKPKERRLVFVPVHGGVESANAYTLRFYVDPVSIPPFPDTKLMVVVNRSSEKEGANNISPAELEFERLFLDKGYRMFDKTQWVINRVKDKRVQQAMVKRDIRLLRTLVANYNADILVYGDVTSSEGNKYDGMVTGNALLSLKAIIIKGDQSEFAIMNQKGNSTEDSPQMAMAMAEIDAARKAFPALMSNIDRLTGRPSDGPTCTTTTSLVHIAVLPLQNAVTPNAVTSRDNDQQHDTPQANTIGDLLAAKLESILLKDPLVTVVSSTRRDEIIREQAFQQTALADPITAVKNGNMLGCEYLICGLVEKYGFRSDSGKTYSMAVPYLENIYRNVRDQGQWEVSVKLKLIDVSTMQLLMATDGREGYGSYKDIFIGKSILFVSNNKMPNANNLDIACNEALQKAINTISERIDIACPKCQKTANLAGTLCPQCQQVLRKPRLYCGTTNRLLPRGFEKCIYCTEPPQPLEYDLTKFMPAKSAVASKIDTFGTVTSAQDLLGNRFANAICYDKMRKKETYDATYPLHGLYQTVAGTLMLTSGSDAVSVNIAGDDQILKTVTLSSDQPSCRFKILIGGIEMLHVSLKPSSGTDVKVILVNAELQ